MSVVLILGASSDIAKATAVCFADAGSDLILAGRDEEELKRDAADFHIRYGVNAVAVKFDALNVSVHAGFYESLSPKPDGVVCAVGYLGNQTKGESTAAESMNILETNFAGCVSILNIVANDFERRRTGFIIAISSVAGDRGRRSNYLYGSAKAGLSTYLSGLRSRLSRANVHVMTVKPGFVVTRMTEGLNLPPLLTATPAKVGRDIFHGQQRRRNILYTPWYWRWIMLVIRVIPESIFKKLPL